MPTLFRLDQGLVEKTREIIGMLIGTENDVSACPAITAIGTTARDKLLASKTDAAAAAIPRFRRYPDPIDEHCLTIHAEAQNNSAPHLTTSPNELRISVRDRYDFRQTKGRHLQRARRDCYFLTIDR
jgi:hypothetical protein